MASSAEEPPPHVLQQQLPQEVQPEPQDMQNNGEVVVEHLFTWLLVLVFGPIVFRAIERSQWVRASPWEAQERQKRLNGSVGLSLLYYIPIWLFHDQIADVWIWLFSLLSQWTHLPLSTFLSSVALWPPFSSTLYRWLLCIPLSSLLARMLQGIDASEGKTVARPVRVVSPDEMLQLAPAPKAKKLKAASRRMPASKAAAVGHDATTPPTARTTHTASPRQPTTGAAGPVTPKATSLWGEWDAVPESDPTKQLLRQATEHEQIEQAKRPRKPQTQQSGRHTHLLPSPKPTPSSITPPASREDEDDYDWNSGDGTVSL